MNHTIDNRMLIRAEENTDWPAVHAINVAAFGTPAEANLVDALRQQAKPTISLVAEENGKIVGHIMFSPVELPGHTEKKIMGLAPMGVMPNHQRHGIGSALVRAGLEKCKQLGFGLSSCWGTRTFTHGSALRHQRGLGSAASMTFQKMCSWRWSLSRVLCRERRARSSIIRHFVCLAKRASMDKPESLDVLFREAVSAIDAGDLAALKRQLAAHPNLAGDRLDSPGAWLRDQVGDALDGFLRDRT